MKTTLIKNSENKDSEHIKAIDKLTNYLFDNFAYALKEDRELRVVGPMKAVDAAIGLLEWASYESSGGMLEYLNMIKTRGL